MPESINVICPACTAPGVPHSLVTESQYRLIRCTACESQYFRPDPELVEAADDHTVSEYWEQYKFDLYGSSVIQEAFAGRYDHVLRQAREYVNPLTSILDIGCGIGNFVAHAETVGLRAVGSDVDAGAIDVARGRGLTAYVVDEMDAAVADGAVDAVSLWDVVEHLFDPAAVLQQVLAKVRPGGAVLIETPDAEFPVRRALLAGHQVSGGRLDLTGPMYYWEHKIYFSERGLRILLGRLGVDVVWVHRETSLREKMVADFSHDNDGTVVRRFLDNTWPLLETTFRRLGRGNKLLMVGRVRG